MLVILTPMVRSQMMNTPQESEKPSRARRKRPMIELPKGVNVAKIRGRRYFYFQPGRGTRNAKPAIRLPDDPHSPEFWAEYARLSGAGTENHAPRPGTFDALITAYTASPEFARKAERTKKLNISHLRIITEIWGPRLVKGVRARHVLERP